MKTVWSKNSMPLVPPRFRPLYQWVFPAVDAVLVGYGCVAFFIGSQTVQDFTIPLFGFVWSAVMLLAALTAGVGLVFMWEHLELAAKFVLVVGFGVYASILGLHVAHGSPSSLLSIGEILVVVGFLGFRIGDLIGEIGREEADRDC